MDLAQQAVALQMMAENSSEAQCAGIIMYVASMEDAEEEENRGTMFVLLLQFYQITISKLKIPYLL
jgi:hypothetical protein